MDQNPSPRGRAGQVPKAPAHGQPLAVQTARLVGLATLVLVGAAMMPSCGGPDTVEVDLMAAPSVPLDRSELSPNHPLASFVEAYEQGRCRDAMVSAADIGAMVQAEVATLLHDRVEEHYATQIRQLLDQYLYVSPPVLRVGRHRFTFARWWADGYVYCLVELGM